MTFSLTSQCSLIALVLLCFNSEATNAQNVDPFRPQPQDNSIQQCPCVIPPGSNKCAAYDSRYQATTLEEAMISFSDLSLDPRLSDRSSFSNFACQSYECQQCVGALITRFRNIGLLGDVQPVGLDVQAIPEATSQCGQLRFITLPRLFAVPNIVPAFMQDMINEGHIHWKERHIGRGRNRQSGMNRGRGQRSRGNRNHGRRRFPSHPNRRVHTDDRRRQRRREQPADHGKLSNRNNNEHGGSGGGRTQHGRHRNEHRREQFPNQGAGRFPNTDNRNGPNENENNHGHGQQQNGRNFPGGRGPNFGRGPPNAAHRFIDSVVKQVEEHIDRGKKGSNGNNGRGNFQGRHSHENSDGGFGRGGREGGDRFGGGRWNGQQGFNGNGGGGGGQTPFGGVQQGKGGFLGSGQRGGMGQGGQTGLGGVQQGQGGFLGSGQSGGMGQGGQTGFGGVQQGQGGFLGSGQSGGMGQGGQMGFDGGHHGPMNGGFSFGAPGGFGGIGGFGAHARGRRAAESDSKGFIGTRTTVVCAEKGSVDPIDHQKNELGLCSMCWVIRTLPDNYSPRYINELVCSGSDRHCLGGWAVCEQKTRPLMFNRYDRLENGTTVITQVQINAGMCCDCQVLEGSSIFSMIIGRPK